MANKVQHYRSYTAGTVPTTLLPGELGVNIADQRMWFGDNASVPVEMEFSSELPTVSLETADFTVDPADGMNHHYHVDGIGINVFIPDDLPVGHRFQITCDVNTDVGDVPPPVETGPWLMTVGMYQGTPTSHGYSASGDIYGVLVPTTAYGITINQIRAVVGEIQIALPFNLKINGWDYITMTLTEVGGGNPISSTSDLFANYYIFPDPVMEQYMIDHLDSDLEVTLTGTP